MNLWQLGVQLGISGLLAVIGYRITLVFIDRWGKTEDKRTDAISSGLERLADRIDNGFSSMATRIDNISQAQARVEGRVMTPILGVPVESSDASKRARINNPTEYSLKRGRTEG